MQSTLVKLGGKKQNQQTLIQLTDKSIYTPVKRLFFCGAAARSADPSKHDGHTFFPAVQVSSLTEPVKARGRFTCGSAWQGKQGKQLICYFWHKQNGCPAGSNMVTKSFPPNCMFDFEAPNDSAFFTISITLSI